MKQLWSSDARHRTVPEVLQTSSMDCGVAAIKAVLEGHGIHAGYERLREACQTDVDGTSIDVLESLANDLGLEAEQVIMPLDHVFLTRADALPAVAVVLLPAALTHFVVLWRRRGSLIQVMDPGRGRRWAKASEIEKELYVHRARFLASQWRAWAASEGFLDCLKARLQALVTAEASLGLVQQSLEDTTWRTLATTDAAVRMVSALALPHGVRARREAADLLKFLVENSLAAPHGRETDLIPTRYWSARLLASDGSSETMLEVTGAVLVQIRGRTQVPSPDEVERPRLSPELRAALAQPTTKPLHELFHLMRRDGLMAPSVLIGTLAVAAAGVVLEALLLRSVAHMGRYLALSEQRMAGMVAFIGLLFLLLLIDVGIARGLLRMGRRMEIQLRVRFAAKMRTLHDRYLRSRLTSDMAERCHSVHRIRGLPPLGGQLVRAIFELAVTTAGLIWLDERAALAIVTGVAALLVIPLAAQRQLIERELRLRTFAGALGHFHFDSLRGLMPLRTHGGQRAMRVEHESVLVEWIVSARRVLAATVRVELLQLSVGFALAAWLIISHLQRSSDTGPVLLLAYWALNIPALASEIATLTRQYPALRNVTLRLTEPLTAPEEEVVCEDNGPPQPSLRAGVRIQFRDVSVRAGGQSILSNVDLTIEPGEHVAILGGSGAGKSTLVGLLLGWHRAWEGMVLIDGHPLDVASEEGLRRVTAWVDPSVYLWNRSFLENLRYGSTGETAALERILSDADLRGVLERLPEGLQTRLGEGGGLLSGGEGQRVRFGRALGRPEAGLVVLDEPFRGLPHEERQASLRTARQLWRNATILCVTHDVAQTQSFDRVVVLVDGRVAETGTPSELSARASSRYAWMLARETTVLNTLWKNDSWRHVRVMDGRLEVEGRAE